mmetsp:Transcript_10303/g.19508  ORF Transcript_10303/g.19508 Transcript_10303/m.19508 type:complete len:88 (+) Transcript_10303:98-361(+)
MHIRSIYGSWSRKSARLTNSMLTHESSYTMRVHLEDEAQSSYFNQTVLLKAPLVSRLHEGVVEKNGAASHVDELEGSVPQLDVRLLP